MNGLLTTFIAPLTGWLMVWMGRRKFLTTYKSVRTDKFALTFLTTFLNISNGQTNGFKKQPSNGMGLTFGLLDSNYIIILLRKVNYFFQLLFQIRCHMQSAAGILWPGLWVYLQCCMCSNLLCNPALEWTR